MKKTISILLAVTMLIACFSQLSIVESNAITNHKNMIASTWPEYIDAPENEFIITENLRIDVSEEEIDSMAERLLANSDYGKNMTSHLNDTGGWYGTLSTVEILARLIFAENAGAGRNNERRAIAWTLVNRYNYAGGRYPSTLRGIATESLAYSSIDPGSTLALNPKGTTGYLTGWREATWYACLLCTTDVVDYIEQFMGKPRGIEEQRHFYAMSTYLNLLQSNMLGTRFRDNTSGTGIQIKVGGTWCDIGSVTVLSDFGDTLTHTDISSIEELNGIVNSILASTDVNSNVSQHNIYYTMLTGE